MGCGVSTPKNRKLNTMTKSEKAMKATLLIQRWYRRYLARLEARKRYSWSIFQSMEYSSEQDQLKLYNFFNDLIHMTSPDVNGTRHEHITALMSNSLRPGSGRLKEMEDEELLSITNPEKIHVHSQYKGPHITLPMDKNQLDVLIAAFKKKQHLHAKYVLRLLLETRKVLRTLPTINQASTNLTKRLTICGDLHGKLDDLLIIFHKNGLPSTENPYVFNGDFVDRGPNSVEIACILFSCLLISPNEVYINRGNHEDHMMNIRYGFIKEITAKYRHQAPKIMKLFEDVFSWLPLATLVDKKVFITHGGISDLTDLNYLNGIDRHKYISVLRPPEDDNNDKTEVNEESDKVDLKEWRQVLDILWSDPRPQNGCSPNTFRGGGCYFGPDTTSAFLKKNNLELLVRSHECKPDGYEFDHDRKVLTIFSASNYYELGSNKGAYLKLGPDLVPRIVQYMASRKATRKLTIHQRVGLVEESALRSLKEKIYCRRTTLLEEFGKIDLNNTGFIQLREWCDVMSRVLQMDLPWRSLRSQLVRATNNGVVEYSSTVDEYFIYHKCNQEGASVTETLYRYKDSLETIFRAMDKDNSGFISMEEFTDACEVLSKHTSTPMDRSDIEGMARNMDMNKDGQIDFNEFLEAFRIVDVHGKELKYVENIENVSDTASVTSEGTVRES